MRTPPRNGLVPRISDRAADLYLHISGIDAVDGGLKRVVGIRILRCDLLAVGSVLIHQRVDGVGEGDAGVRDLAVG